MGIKDTKIIESGKQDILYENTLSARCYRDTNKTTTVEATLVKQDEEITDLKTMFESAIQTLIYNIYPIGSIKMTFTHKNPGDTIPLTKWELTSQGKYIRGVDPTVPALTPAKTGGSNIINIAHTHTVNGHAHVINHTHDIANHAHTIDHAHSINGHSHTINHAHGLPNHAHDITHNHSINGHSHTIDHAHSINGHSHVVNNHAHLGSGHVLTINEMPSHAHNMQNWNPAEGYEHWYPGNRADGALGVSGVEYPIRTHHCYIGMDLTGGSGSHNHGWTGGSAPSTNAVGLSTNSGGGSSGATGLTTNNGGGTSGAAALSTNSGGGNSSSTVLTTNTGGGTSGLTGLTTNTGGGNSAATELTTNSTLGDISIQPEFQTLYVWKRIS